VAARVGRRVPQPAPAVLAHEVAVIGVETPSQRACYSASGVDGLALPVGVPAWCKAPSGRNIGVVVRRCGRCGHCYGRGGQRRGRGPALGSWPSVVVVVLRCGRGGWGRQRRHNSAGSRLGMDRRVCVRRDGVLVRGSVGSTVGRPAPTVPAHKVAVVT
jgi:hypothetical protein